MSGVDPRELPLDAATLEDLSARVLGPLEEFAPLSGDASTRRFFRARCAGGKPVVAMVLEGPFDPRVHPQVLVGSYFESIGLPVPRLEGSIPDAGILFYEDLGDQLLQGLVEQVLGRSTSDPASAGRSERRGKKDDDRGDATGRARLTRLYREAVGMLAVLQGPGTRGLPPDHPSQRVALDEERFLFELLFFREHYIEGFRDLTLGPREAEVLDTFLRDLARAASAPPRVLCHRDFHSRNLLVQDDRLRLVDFQDARLGPVAYDLASLLRDSYVDLPRDLKEALFAAFLIENAAHVPSADQFREQYEIVALQRNLKAIGTFGYQAVMRGKTHYLPYIAPTWRSALAALDRVPALANGGVKPILEMLATG